MKRFFRHFPLVAALLFAGAAFGADLSEPIKNFLLPTFTPEGYRSMLLHGSEARMIAPRLIELEDMNLTVFSGDAASHIDSILLSPLARVSLDDNTVRGPGAVRLVRDDLDLAGEDWIFYRVEKRISIARNVRVVFHTEIKDLLK